MTEEIKEYYKKAKGEKLVTWKDVEQCALDIVHKIKEDDFEPDIIISIARSGLIPASLVSYALGNKELYVIKTDLSLEQKVGKDQEMRRKPKISQELSKDIEGMKVLVVDEMAVSGSTLQLVSDYLEMKHPAEVRFSVMYKMPWAEFEPDYYGVEKEEWPIFPWKRLKEV
jgi:hypoxanthine phosphoribosyltransferase